MYICSLQETRNSTTVGFTTTGAFTGKVEIFLEQREVASLSPSKILLGDKNATYLCPKIISTLRYAQILVKQSLSLFCNNISRGSPENKCDYLIPEYVHDKIIQA